MSFAFPVGLTLAVLAIPIVLLYILKVRLRRVPVSTNMFWKQIYDEKPPRAIWQRFRHLASLLLQLLFLLLLILAIADPQFAWQTQQARRVVLVMDHSASMRATDILPSRLEAARKAACNIIEGLRFQDEVAVVLAGSSPEVIQGMTSHAPQALKVIRAIQYSDGPANLKPAIELAKTLIGQHPHGQILVLTDGCLVDRDLSVLELPAEETESTSKDAGSIAESDEGSSDPSARDAESTASSPVQVDTTLLQPSIPIDVYTFGSDVGNIGITQMSARRTMTDPLGYEVLIKVRNASAVPVSCRLELTRDDVPVDIIPLSLQPDETWSRSLQKTSLEGGVLTASLTQIIGVPAANVDPSKITDPTSTANSFADFLTVDNTAWAQLPDRAIQKVLIVSPGNLFLQKAFEANPLTDVTIRSTFPNQWPTDTLVVLHRNVPQQLPAGNVLIIDPANDCELWQQGPVLVDPIITDQDEQSPLMRFVRLDNIAIPETRQLQFVTEIHPLAKTLSGDVVYAQVKRSGGRCVVLGVSLDRSDLAFRTVFPILVSNSLGWFADTSGELIESATTGSVTSVGIPIQDLAVSDATTTTQAVERTPSESSRVIPESNPRLESPSGKRISVSVITDAFKSDETARVTIGPLNEAGIWKLYGGPPGPQGSQSLATVVVNLANERETDLRPALQLLQKKPAEFVTANWFNRPMWFYLCLAACLLTCVEWFLYQRRWIS
jgi:hypothetical protein